LKETRVHLSLTTGLRWFMDKRACMRRRSQSIKKRLTFQEAGRIVAELGYIYAVSRKRSEAQKALEELKELSKRRYVSSFYMALIYMGLGEKDQAFALFERAYEERSPRLIELKVDPIFDPLRSDQRFAELMRKVGFTSLNPLRTQAYKK
jgi:tetratricopeptide (TPR) repeat protein